MWSDPIADFCTIIRNGYLAKKTKVEVPYSRIKEIMAKILAKEGYIENSKLKTLPRRQAGQSSKLKKLIVELKYDENGQPSLREIQRVSRPGRRIYKNAKNLPRILSGLGGAIISTPKGLLTNKEAKKLNLGGEVICKFW